MDSLAFPVLAPISLQAKTNSVVNESCFRFQPLPFADWELPFSFLSPFFLLQVIVRPRVRTLLFVRRFCALLPDHWPFRD
jgi:hypothetical protein